MSKDNYKKSGTFFVNPYNFVPVNLAATPRSDITQNQDERVTGYFECILKCRTPLIIPGIPESTDSEKQNSDKAENKHHVYPFFSSDGVKPVIPGSAIRGVIRNVYETLTDSCFGTMKKDTAITIRSKDALKPGLLIRDNEGWKLYEAKRRLLVTDPDFYKRHSLDKLGVILYDEQQWNYRTGDPVNFNLIYERNRKEAKYKNKKNIEIGSYANIADEGSNFSTGYLCIGEKAPKRHFQSIFEKQKALRKVTETDFVKLETVLEVYRNKKINQKYTIEHNGYPDYEYAKQNGVIPIYYWIEGKNLYLSPAALGRKAFQKTLNDKAKEKNHQRCNSRSNLCPACALFGTIEGEKLGSKIRITDATCMDATTIRSLKQITLAELSTPRISYLPFYLKGNKSMINYSEGYDSRDLNLRGRKFYWHHTPKIKKNVTKNKRNGSFYIINTDTTSEDKKTTFKFKIYFDEISRDQMELLASAVHLNENNLNGKYCHKLGHGKPLGYGSAKMIIQECKIRKFTEDGWQEEEESIPCNPKCYTCGEKTYKSLMAISNFEALKNLNGIDICYPQIENSRSKDGDEDARGYQWFSENYKLGGKSPIDTLPEIQDKDIQDKDITLEKYMLTSSDKDEKVYRAEIASSAHMTQNSNFLEYDVKILDSGKFRDKSCTMTAHKNNSFSKGDQVEAVLYRGTVFNFKK